MNGVIFDSKSSEGNLAASFSTMVRALGPPPPNSTDLTSSGRTLDLKNSSGKSSVTFSNSLAAVLDRAKQREDMTCRSGEDSLKELFPLIGILHSEILNPLCQMNQGGIEI